MRDEGSGVVVKAILMGMPWMVPAGWRNRLPEVPWRALEALPEGRLGHGMNKFTLLDDAVRGFGGAAPEGRTDEAGRRQRLAEVRDPSGEHRRLFGVGEGPVEAVAGAKQDWVVMPEICVNFVSVATGKSLLAPLVTHLSTT